VLRGIAGTACSLVAPLPALAQSDPTAPEPITISARPILHFEKARPDARRFGELEFRGGLVLTSQARNFGGWSGLVVEPDGSGLLAVSDEGFWLSAEIAYEAGRPAALQHAVLGALVDAGGRPFERKQERDAEAVTLLEGSLARGTLLIAFERDHRLLRYEARARRVLMPTGQVALPSEARRMYPNQGIEAVAVLQSGTFKGSLVAFAERLTRGSGFHTGWIWVRGEPRRMQVRDIGQFNITDATGLPDGGLLVLERRFRWEEGVKMRLRRIQPAEIAPGARISGQTLIEADARYEIDNMEAVAVHRGPKSEIIVTLMSDDNFNTVLQRTLLLQFKLADGDSRRTARP
jgi:hypothetical protein